MRPIPNPDQSLLAHINFLKSRFGDPATSSLVRLSTSKYFYDPSMVLHILWSITPTIAELRDHFTPVLLSILASSSPSSYDIPRVKHSLHSCLLSNKSVISPTSCSAFCIKILENCLCSLGFEITTEARVSLSRTLSDFLAARSHNCSIRLAKMIKPDVSDVFFLDDGSLSLCFLLETIISDIKSKTCTYEAPISGSNTETPSNKVNNEALLQRFIQKVGPSAHKQDLITHSKQSSPSIKLDKFNLHPPPLSPIQIATPNRSKSVKNEEDLELDDFIKELGDDDQEEEDFCIHAQRLESKHHGSNTRPKSAPQTTSKFLSGTLHSSPRYFYRPYSAVTSSQQNKNSNSSMQHSYRPPTIHEKGEAIRNLTRARCRLYSATSTYNKHGNSDVCRARERLYQVSEKSVLVDKLVKQLSWLDTGLFVRLELDEIKERFKPILGPKGITEEQIKEGTRISRLRGLTPLKPVTKLSINDLLSAARYLNDKEAMSEFIKVIQEQTPLKLLGLSNNFTLVELRTNYRDLSREFHPDRTTSMTPAAHGTQFKKFCGEVFCIIHSAYKELEEKL
ncbi:hypothetical protein P9112_008944 [Eukaryota sp. TZLM1-RC]